MDAERFDRLVDIIMAQVDTILNTIARTILLETEAQIDAR